MTTRDDLVSLARNFIDDQDAGIGDAWALIDELADTLEANCAEIARLTADRNQMMKQVAELGRQLAAETERIAAEVEARNWPTVGDARRIAAAIRGGAK